MRSLFTDPKFTVRLTTVMDGSVAPIQASRLPLKKSPSIIAASGKWRPVRMGNELSLYFWFFIHASIASRLKR
jgi:hypothetical protein